MGEFFRRLKLLLNRRQFNQELNDEMEFHREMTALEGGRAFGNTLRLKEEARDAWGWTWIERLFQDLRYAARQAKHSPGFTAAAVVTLALGIGVNVAGFGFLNLMMLRPLPVRHPESLLRFKRRAPQSYASHVPYPEMDFVRQYSKMLSAVIAINDGKLALDGEAKPIAANFVTNNYFNELGALPLAGRLIEPADEHPVIVLSRGFWERHFGARPNAVGETMRLNGKPAEVIGVASEKFSGLSMDKPDVWIPIKQQPYFVTGSHLLTDFSLESSGVAMFGRLATDANTTAAETELTALASELRKQHPQDIWEKESLVATPGGFAENLGGSHYGSGKEAPSEALPLIALGGTLGLLILTVCCGNLGSLLLARGVSREREITIRTAIGAGTKRLIRQLFTESLLLALLGSASGLLLGYFLLRSLLALSEVPAWLNATPDWRVAAFAGIAGVLAAILFGLTPAVQMARQRHRVTRTRQALIGAQVMASCVLVVVSALLVRALNHALTARPGFEFKQIVSIDPALAAHGFTAAQARSYLDVLKTRLAQTPGIQSVSMTSSPPLGNRKVTTGADIEGRSIDVHMYAIEPEFFKTMSIPLLQGRNIVRSDTQALIISQSLAAQWPKASALGDSFQMGSTSFSVVGVAGSARLVALQDADAVEAYYNAGDADLPNMVVIVRAAGPPEGLLLYLSSIAKSIDPKVLPEVQLVKTSFSRKMTAARDAALAVSLLGGAALLLASLGIVGLVIYTVSQRAKEIGIRMALGARPAHVLAIALFQLTRPVAIGLVLGVCAAAALSQMLRHQLYGIGSLDPLAYIAAIALFSATVALAAIWPARRALRVDPATTLRCE